MIVWPLDHFLTGSEERGLKEVSPISLTCDVMTSLKNGGFKFPDETQLTQGLPGTK